MKKHFYLSLILISLALKSYAQPQFSYTQGPAAYNTIPFNNNTNLRQWLYYPSNFPGMPVGYITKIFIKAQTTVTPSFALLTVKMGTTSLSNFTSGPYAGGLTTVYQGAYSAATSSGNWLEIQLQTPFYYDSLQNFIVECSQIGNSPGFNVMQTNSGVPGRSLAGTITASTATMQNVVAQIGFEQQGQGSPLAVTLKDFTASSQNGDNLLTWTVAEENDMDQYQIERSTDGVSFENIGSVFAEPQFSEEKEYSYSDRYLPSFTNSGKLFYRLRMIDIAGNETVSPTVVLKLTDKENAFHIIAAPVPFSQNLTLSLTLSHEQPCTIVVRDVMGRALINRSENLSAGTTSLSLRELDQYNSGTYFITASTAEDHQTIRILKY